MKTIIILAVFFCVTFSCSAQTGEAIIKYKPTNISLYESGLDQTLKGKGVVRLTFDNKDNLNVTKSELVYLTVFDSITNEKSVDYRISQELKDSSENIEFYTSKLDSVFKKLDYEIVNENYKNFIPRADFPFTFRVHPLVNTE